MSRDGREVRGGSTGSSNEARSERPQPTAGKLTLTSLLPTPVRQRTVSPSPGQARGGPAEDHDHAAAARGGQEAGEDQLVYSAAQLQAIIRQSGIAEAEIERMVIDAGLTTQQIAALRSGSALALTPEQDASLRASLATVYARAPGEQSNDGVQDGSTCGCSGNPSAPPTHQTVPAVTSTVTHATEQTAGTTVHTGNVGGGTVTVRQDLRVQVGGTTRPPAFAIGYQGPDSQNTHWLQFIWREIIQMDSSNNVTAMTGPITTNGGTYDLTTGGTLTAPGTPGVQSYNTDTASRTDPFYEAGFLNNRTADATTMYDHPSAADPYVQRAFANGATEVKSRAHFNTFLVQTDRVTYRTQTNMEWHFTSASATPSPAFSTGSNGPATTLSPDAIRDRFHTQFPTFSFIQ
jgi:hypothetical protein